MSKKFFSDVHIDIGDLKFTNIDIRIEGNRMDIDFDLIRQHQEFMHREITKAFTMPSYALDATSTIVDEQSVLTVKQLTDAMAEMAKVTIPTMIGIDLAAPDFGIIEPVKQETKPEPHSAFRPWPYALED